ncbi:MAG: multicopper oxidase domain-containing protein [Actinomycetota bacterium]
MRHPIRRWGLVAALAVLALVSAACTSGGSSGGAGGGGGGEQAAAAPVKVQVELSEFKIDPSAITVPAGQPVEFKVMNMGTTQHSFAVDVGGKTYATALIEANATAELPVPALAAGTYTAYCTVPGHKDLGMVATIVAGASTGTGSSGDTSTTGMANMTAQQMADMHKAGVEAFLAGNQTSTQGNRVLKPTVDGNVKVFTLTAQQIKWEVSKGDFVDAMAYNGQIPGPQLQVSYGDHVRIIVQNQMTQPTIMHFHGMTVPNAMDGVPYITQDPIMPGQFWTYEFTVKDPPGMYVYHSHFNSTEQVGKGLFGSIIIEPKDHRWPYRALNMDPRTGFSTIGAPVTVNDEYTLFLDDGPLGYTLNAKSFPATTPLVAKKGDWVLIHMANDGSMLHPMHLHGYHFEVVAQDGFPLEQPYLADTLVIAPGQRFDVLIPAIYPGAWAFHCHILPHVEGPQGMYGMVTALVVQ